MKKKKVDRKLLKVNYIYHIYQLISAREVDKNGDEKTVLRLILREGMQGATGGNLRVH